MYYTAVIAMCSIGYAVFCSACSSVAINVKCIANCSDVPKCLPCPCSLLEIVSTYQSGIIVSNILVNDIVVVRLFYLLNAFKDPNLLVTVDMFQQHLELSLFGDAYNLHV